MAKRYIVRVSRREFVLRQDEDAKHAVWNTVWNLDLEDRKKVLVQCYEYEPDIDSSFPGWEGPLFSDDHTNPPFEPNWVVRYGQNAEVL